MSRDAQKKKDDEDEATMRKEMRETWAKNWEESRQGRLAYAPKNHLYYEQVLIVCLCHICIACVLHSIFQG